MNGARLKQDFARWLFIEKCCQRTPWCKKFSGEFSSGKWSILKTKWHKQQFRRMNQTWNFSIQWISASKMQSTEALMEEIMPVVFENIEFENQQMSLLIELSTFCCSKVQSVSFIKIFSKLASVDLLFGGRILARSVQKIWFWITWKIFKMAFLDNLGQWKSDWWHKRGKFHFVPFALKRFWIENFLEESELAQLIRNEFENRENLKIIVLSDIFCILEFQCDGKNTEKYSWAIFCILKALKISVMEEIKTVVIHKSEF